MPLDPHGSPLYVLTLPFDSMEVFMRHVSLAVVLGAIVVASPAASATNTEKCEATKEKAAGKFALCRLAAESRFTKNQDATKLGLGLSRCADKLQRLFDQADSRYGVDCPTSGDLGTVRQFLEATTDQLTAYLADGTPAPGGGFCGALTVYDTGTGTCLPTCGDGVVQVGEDCDDGDLAGADCSTLGLFDGVLRCAPGCSFDVADCLTCGNGVLDPGEECDGGALGGETCSSQGLGVGSLGCLANCTFDTSGCPGTNAGSCGVLFDQTSFDAVTFPDDLAWDVGASGVTVEMWFNPLSFTLGGTSHILFEAFVTKYKLSIAGGNQVNFITTSLTPPNDAFAVTSFPANTWTHIAAVWDGVEKRVYVNGVNSGSTASSGSITGVTGVALSHGSHPVLGVIDELRVSSTARYSADFTPAPRFAPDASTVGLWHFDECSGTLGADDGANGLDAFVSVNRTWYGDSQP